MSQAVETPDRPAIDPKVQAKIWAFKAQVKIDAEELHLLKLCRRTKNCVHPEREALMTKFKCETHSDVQREIWSRKFKATARLVAYGQLRGKPHLKESGPWASLAEKMLNE